MPQRSYSVCLRIFRDLAGHPHIGALDRDLLGFEVEVRVSCGNSNTAFTASLDALSIKVDYTTPYVAAAPTYDDNGNLLTDGNRTYTYDGFGRLAAVGGPTVATYTRDGAGNRLAQTVAGLTTNFDLDLRSATPTILSDGTRRYVPADPSAGYEQADVWSSALDDQLGSPHSTVSQAGVQGTIARFDPYGAARPANTIAPGPPGREAARCARERRRRVAEEPLVGPPAVDDHRGADETDEANS